MPVEEQVVSIFCRHDGHPRRPPRRAGAPVRGGPARGLPHPPRRPPRRDQATPASCPRATSSTTAIDDFKARFVATVGGEIAADEAASRAENPEDFVGGYGLAMAGGQERILKRRIRTVQSTKKITRAMELIAASRIVKAQARVERRVPYSDQITEVIHHLAAGRRRRQQPAAQAARRDPQGRVRGAHRRPRPLRRVQLHGDPPGRALAQGAAGPRAATTR